MTGPLDRSKLLQGPSFLERPADEVDRRDDDYIADRGSHVDWDLAHHCANTDAQGKPKFDCTYCHGFGWVYTSGGQIPMLAQAMTFSKRLLPGGVIFPGTMTASVGPSVLVGYMDRFTFQDEYVVMVELMKRKTGTLVDRLRHPLWKEIISIRDNTREYVNGTDYTAVSDDLTWNDEENVPADGAHYSIRYVVHPRYYCIDPPQPRADAHNRKPFRQASRMVLRREDLLDTRYRT